METIDLTPTWKEALKMLIFTLDNATDTGREMAIEELNRMADLADMYVKENKQ